MKFNGRILCEATRYSYEKYHLPSERAQSLREAHARGITKDQIEHALRIMPFVRINRPYPPL
jgi:hypothetical protein